MRIIVAICLFVFLFSCKQKEEEFVEYSYFTADIWNPKTMETKIINYKVLLKGDSISIYKRNNGLQNRFKFTLDKKGIYVVNNDEKKLLYPFEQNVKLLRDSILAREFYKEVELVEKKKYIINEEEYHLYHYLESGYDSTLDSYYLEGEGFICFYEFRGSEFIYLDSPKALDVFKLFSEDYSFNAVLKAEMIKQNVLKSKEN